jgi:hypothetical protein
MGRHLTPRGCRKAALLGPRARKGDLVPTLVGDLQPEPAGFLQVSQGLFRGLAHGHAPPQVRVAAHLG